jgi:hypothetical protein
LRTGAVLLVRRPPASLVGSLVGTVDAAGEMSALLGAAGVVSRS